MEEKGIEIKAKVAAALHKRIGHTPVERDVSLKDAIIQAMEMWIAESTEMADRKAVKINPELHKQIDIESAQRDVPHYALIAEAWECYLEVKKGKQSTRQTDERSDITQTLNDSDVERMREALSRAERESQAWRDVIRELGQQVADLRGEVKRIGKTRRGDPKPDPDSKKRAGRKG